MAGGKFRSKFLEKSNPGGFGAELKTSAQQPYNLESFREF
jgi:hypothetical protein